MHTKVFPGIQRELLGNNMKRESYQEKLASTPATIQKATAWFTSLPFSLLCPAEQWFLLLQNHISLVYYLYILMVYTCNDIQPTFKVV